MFSGIKEKIQKKLDVPDKEFEKVGRNTITSYVRPPDPITSYLFQANQKSVSEHIETLRDMMRVTVHMSDRQYTVWPVLLIHSIVGSPSCVEAIHLNCRDICLLKKKNLLQYSIMNVLPFCSENNTEAFGPYDLGKNSVVLNLLIPSVFSVQVRHSDDGSTELY